MEETNTLRPMGFGELFSTTFALIRRTLPTAGILAIIILIGLGLLQSFSTMSYLDAMVKAAATGGLLKGASQEDGTAAAEIVLGGAVPLFLATLLNFVGAIFVMTMLTVAGWFSINGEDLRTKELLNITAGRPFWMAVIQTILFLFFIALITMVGAIFIFGTSGTGLESVLMYVGALVLMYPIIATIFRIHNIVAQDRGPWQGMIASIALANSNFGRLFGALALAAIIYGAIVWLLVLAVGGNGMGGNMIGFPMMNQGDGLNEEQARAIRDNVTWGTSIVSVLLNTFFLMFISYLLTPLYVDLRARRGDFDQEAEGYGSF